MTTLFKLLLPKVRYMGGKKWCKINLDTMREIYMMAVINLKTDRDKSLPPQRPPQKLTLR